MYLRHPTAMLEDGTILPIEEIYTVVDGMQINIPGILEKTKKLSKAGKLFCPCGCGNNLILKASQQRLVTQHFALKRKEGCAECREVGETYTTVASRIVLKCWLDDMFFNGETSDVKINLPFSKLVSDGRHFEFSLLSLSQRVGVVYACESVDLEPERLDYLYKQDLVNTLIVTDIRNRDCKGQYPEYNMRQQSVQGFCFFLSPMAEYRYSSACVSFYKQNYHGYWQEIRVCEGHLRDFSFEDGELCYMMAPVRHLLKESLDTFAKYETALIAQEKEMEQRKLLREQKNREEYLANMQFLKKSKMKKDL